MTTRFRPGVLSRFLARVDALPAHGWWVPLVLLVGLFAWSHGVLWVAGQVRVGSTDPVIAASLFYPPYTLAAIVAVNRAAERALAAFWPATGWPIGEQVGWRYRFLNSPAGYGLLAIVAGMAVAVAAFLPASESYVAGGNRIAVFAAYFPVASLGYALVILVVVHTVHQLRLVARIHREATAIDPFDRASIYAFSSMTAVTGLAYVASGYFTVAFNGRFQAGNAVGLAVLAVVFAVGVACFVLPLWGIHDRLVDEKDRLVREVELRLGRLGDEMYRRVDAGQIADAKTVSDALAGVFELRRRVIEVPTWPWRPQVLSGFISALLLPVAVFVLTRIVGGQLGT